MLKDFFRNNRRSLILAGAILLLSGGVTAALIGFSAEPEAPEEDKNIRLVETKALRYEPYTMNVTGRGFIRASRSLVMAGQAGGTVTYSKDDLKSGTTVEKDDLLLSIDDEVLRNSLSLSRVGLISSTAQLVSALKSEGGAIYSKWNAYLKNLGTEEEIAAPLPVLSSEREKLMASTYGVLSAYYQVRELENTVKDYRVYAPFAGTVEGDGVENHSFVSPGQPLLTLTDSRHLEITVPLTREEILMLEDISDNVIIRPAGVDDVALQGRLARKDAVMDPNSQTIAIHIIFENAEANPLFFPGNYGEAEIAGVTLDQALLIPRSLVNADDTINIFEEGELRKYPVKILYVRGDQVILAPTLPEGLELITTRIQKPFEGMKLKTEESES